MLVLIALIVLLVVFLLDWLDYLLEFLGGVLVEGVEDGAGEFLPVSDDTVPLLFQRPLFNHGPVIILPLAVIRVHSQFHQPSLLYLTVRQPMLLLLVSLHQTLLFHLNLHLRLYLLLIVFQLIVQFLILLLYRVKDVNPLLTFLLVFMALALACHRLQRVCHYTSHLLLEIQFL
jgi:hypothetical protein